MVCEHLKVQQKPNKAPMQLMEVFCEVSMLCLCVCETGNIKILEILLLRFGAVVIDQDVHFNLRLEAIKTINSMLDSASKEARKKVCHTDHSSLLEEFARAIIDVGDYEMQVAISEALCRMTPKKQREELVGKWFGCRSFASTFSTIRVKEFETLFKPDDELLLKFWIDFNIGTSCIGFYVNDPQETLWEHINLPKEAVRSYNLQECYDQKILSIHMSLPVCHGKITGKMVQITFEYTHDIQTAVNKVYFREDKLQLLETTKGLHVSPSCVVMTEYRTIFSFSPVWEKTYSPAMLYPTCCSACGRTLNTASTGAAERCVEAGTTPHSLPRRVGLEC
ncbi:Synaptonemal complex protein 2-like [Bagarius yarrelli]|uniref:Synaptonemal complex protein 2-like n=1 Tax=Bagarius yarrelli TaxID=175774 RepID=A0A556V1S7_BAGYA|nr:Synaptonemal complex protein 2-like [Bagarius yarrelli]